MNNSQNQNVSELNNLQTISASAMCLIKEANSVMDKIHLQIAKEDAKEKNRFEIERLKKSLADLTPEDDSTITINNRIEYLLSPKYQQYLNAKCELNQLCKNIKREMLYGLYGFVKLLLIIGFNLLALLFLWSMVF